DADRPAVPSRDRRGWQDRRGWGGGLPEARPAPGRGGPAGGGGGVFWGCPPGPGGGGEEKRAPGGFSGGGGGGGGPAGPDAQETSAVRGGAAPPSRLVVGVRVCAGSGVRGTRSGPGGVPARLRALHGLSSGE